MRRVRGRSRVSRLVLERLREARQVTAAEIRGYLDDMAQEIRELEDRLRRLCNAAETAVAARGITKVGNRSPAALRRSQRGQAPSLLRQASSPHETTSRAFTTPITAAWTRRRQRARARMQRIQ